MKKISFLAIIFFLLAHPVMASDIYFSGSSQVGLNEFFEIIMYVDTDKPINAVSGRIIFDKNLLSLEAHRTGGSIVKYWLKDFNRDRISEVSFSGVTPAGFYGKKGQVVKLVFKSLKSGKSLIELKDVKVFLNNGLGTADVVSLTNKSVIVLPSLDGNRPKSLKAVFEDNIPPENFVASIIKNKSFFKNDYYLILDAKDVDSGVDSFYLLESRLPIPLEELYQNENVSWRKIDNPAILLDQKLKSNIYVKAIDRSGNYSIIEISPTNLVVDEDINIPKVIGFAIIIITALLLFVSYKIFIFSNAKKIFKKIYKNNK